MKENTQKPFWELEHEYMKAREGLESACCRAENLLDAIKCGANMTYLDDDKRVGYLDEDGELELYGDFEKKTEQELKDIKVEFSMLDRDDDGYTVACFDRSGDD